MQLRTESRGKNIIVSEGIANKKTNISVTRWEKTTKTLPLEVK